MNISSFVISEIKHNICGKLDVCSICDSSAGRSYKHMDQPRIPSKSMQIVLRKGSWDTAQNKLCMHLF